MPAEDAATPHSPPPSPPPRVAPAVLRIVGTGAIRLVWSWPGIVVMLAVYAAVAVALFHDSYPNLWGGLAAAVAATAWYASPLRTIEARRRARLGSNGASGAAGEGA